MKKFWKLTNIDLDGREICDCIVLNFYKFEIYENAKLLKFIKISRIFMQKSLAYL